MSDTLSALATAYAQRHTTLTQRSQALREALVREIERALRERGFATATIHSGSLQHSERAVSVDLQVTFDLTPGGFEEGRGALDMRPDRQVVVPDPARDTTDASNTPQTLSEMAVEATGPSSSPTFDALQDEDLGLDLGMRKPREKKSRKKAKKQDPRADGRLAEGGLSPEVTPSTPALPSTEAVAPDEHAVLAMPDAGRPSEREALSALFPKATEATALPTPVITKPIPAPPLPAARPQATTPEPEVVTPTPVVAPPASFVSRFPQPLPPLPKLDASPAPAPSPLTPLPPNEPALAAGRREWDPPMSRENTESRPTPPAVPYSRYTWNASGPTIPSPFGEVPMARTPDAVNRFKDGKANTSVPKPIIARVMAADFVHIHEKRLKEAALKSDSEIRPLFEKDYQFTRQEFENRGASADDVVLFNTLLNQVAFESRRIF